MHNAPPVSYPLGRFAAPRRLLGLQVALSLLLLGLWASTQPIGWPWCVAAGANALAVVLSHRLWRAQAGWLCWEGTLWRWRPAGAPADLPLALEGVGEVKPFWDGQNILLLRWQPLTYAGQPTVRWLWLGRQASPQDWLALRRAVWMPHRSGE